MKRSGFVFFALLVLSAVSCGPRDLQRKLSELDRELSRKSLYLDGFNARMDSLRLCLCAEDVSDSLMWETAYSIFSAYSYINADSTLHYLDVLSSYASTPELKYRSEVCRIRSYGVAQDYERLVQSLRQIDPDSVSDGFLQRCFDELQRASVMCPGNRKLKKKILRTALEHEGLDNDVRMRYQGLLLLYDKKYQEALPYFAESYDSASTDHIKALASYNQATCYSHMEDSLNYCVWLADAAIHDMRVPVSEYNSLLELSDALFRRGEYARASRYIQVAMDDALEGKWHTRVQLSAASQNAIFSALDESHSQLMRLLMAFIVFLVGSVAVMLSLMIFAFRQNRHLRALNETVTEMNSRLKDEGRIKENYLFKYMETSVEGIGRLEDYRRQVRQVLKEEGADALMAMLRSPRSRADYKEFYASFDNTFLSLYPDFVSQVNSLMKEDCRFEDKGVLSTDLRILATIRLGFNDSGQIARFLNVPSTSVYTRRSALRRSSTCTKEEFDQRIRQIT